VDYFLNGEISQEAGRLAVRTQLYETERGKLIQERTFSGEDFSLVDDMSTQLRHDLGIPSQAIEEATDLPVSELLTASMPAYRSFVNAARASTETDELRAALADLEEAVAQDPQFAQAHVMLFSIYLNLNRVQEARAAAEAAMQYSYRLPERDQYRLKTIYYWIVRQEADRALAAAGMYAELYPRDTEAHSFLAIFYEARADFTRAVSALERVLELDPSRIDVLPRIAGLYESAGEFEAALENYERYAAESPDDPAAYIALGNHLRTRGQYEAAKRELDRALIVDPDNVIALIALASVERNLGHFDDSLRNLDEALAAAVTAQQRDAVYDAFRSYYELRGQPRRAIDYLHLRWAEMERYSGSFNTIQEKLQTLDTYVAAGLVDVAKDTLAAIAARLAPPYDVLVPIGQLDLYSSLEQADSLEAAIAGLDRFIEAWGIEYARAIQIWASGRLLEIRGECSEAIISYKRALQLAPQGVEFELDIGRCYRKLEDLTLAEDHLGRLLELRPYDPRLRHELALVYADRGQQEKALEHLRVALDIWRDAEPVYEPAREARALRDRLSSQP
jgi:tetratricopeptide (TPR) repeat protein